MAKVLGDPDQYHQQSLHAAVPPQQALYLLSWSGVDLVLLLLVLIGAPGQGY